MTPGTATRPVSATRSWSTASWGCRGLASRTILRGCVVRDDSGSRPNLAKIRTMRGRAADRIECCRVRIDQQVEVGAVGPNGSYVVAPIPELKGLGPCRVDHDVQRPPIGLA